MGKAKEFSIRFCLSCVEYMSVCVVRLPAQSIKAIGGKTVCVRVCDCACVSCLPRVASLTQQRTAVAHPLATRYEKFVENLRETPATRGPNGAGRAFCITGGFFRKPQKEALFMLGSSSYMVFMKGLFFELLLVRNWNCLVQNWFVVFAVVKCWIQYPGSLAEIEVIFQKFWAVQFTWDTIDHLFVLFPFPF